MRYLILVPNAEARLRIDDGSAMVTPDPLTPAQPGSNFYTVHYESNRSGASNLNRFVEKCLHAAGRAEARYPTIARSALLEADFHVVGKFDLLARTITEISDPIALERWAGPIGDLTV